MTLFEDDGSRIFREPGAGQGGRKPRNRVAFWMSVLAVVATGLFVLTTLPSSPLSWLTHYSMSAELTRVADRIGFTDEGLAIFEDTEPELLSDAPFREACVDDSEAGDDGDGSGSTVGCYYGIGDTGRIAIFEPSDDRLADQVAVTAAHEFLHAAYDRLTSGDRDRLDVLLADRWAQVPADDPLRDNLEMSAQGHADAVGTEEFAYLGSEIADAGPELEAYYAPYFRDRQAVVAIDAADEAMWASVDADYRAAVDALAAADEADAAARRAEVDRLDADYEALIAASTPH
ncbi:hypothetical protein [Herbiconiux ginsengi]|uniref:hypothetical protein n=1 Tax=Herbiconiux ginsengi TaxID=381665 RepID=UPI000B86CD79|nr:hypothetical protein [Herbiconiux ginsengi]